MLPVHVTALVVQGHRMAAAHSQAIVIARPAPPAQPVARVPQIPVMHPDQPQVVPGGK